MAFVRLAYFPGGTADQFAAVSAAVGPVEPPADRLVFAAGEVDGGWQVVQVWTSREALEAFNRTVFRPAVAAAGGRGFTAQPVVVDFEPSQLMLTGPDRLA